MKKKLLRWLYRVAVLLLALGIPFTALGGVDVILGNDVDAISSATSYTFDKSDVTGQYVVFINTSTRSEDTVKIWSDFFAGEDIPIVLEDITCLVCKGDTLALDYAKICQARLPENQMKIKTENSLLVCSKGEYARFDIILMSKELADNFSAQSFSENNQVKLVNIV